MATLAAMVPGLAWAAAAKPIELTELVVAEKLKAGVRYDVGLRFTRNAPADITRVCFRWSGEGPFCWDTFTVDESAGLIRTQAYTGNPNTYTLEGYVEYNDGAVHISNRVSAPIDVRR
jgi:hypothetical protein